MEDNYSLMANYGSYKKIASDQFLDNSVTTDKLELGAGKQSNVLWIFNTRGFACRNCANNGNCCEQANGKCCLWTVPAFTSCVTFEIWSGGGGGAGHTCCNCCSFSAGGAGGNYAIKTISTEPGCQYTVCAGGSWPCEKSHTCAAGMGCRSYVTGYNLSNFCVTGGCGGWMCNGSAWGTRHHSSGCANCNICSSFGADFGASGTVGFKVGQTMCRCNGSTSFTGTAPYIGLAQSAAATEAWCSCGCYVNWPAGGGVSGVSNYCGNWAKCCAGGSGQGGSGIVKITYY
jgi:hypothetical protein